MSNNMTGKTKQLASATERALKPKLRFPEFRNAKEWEKKKIVEVCNVLQGYGFPEVMQGKTEGKYPFCKVSDISKAVNERNGLLAEAANYVDDNDLQILKAKPISKGTTVFAKIGEALRLNRRAITTVDCLIDNNTAGLKAKNSLADDYFIFILAQQIDLNGHCGGAVPSVNKTTLEGIGVPVPSLLEQQKIATCLSSLDELITAEAQKLETLRTHKKGLMQQLFPSAGETLPRLRFANEGDWTVVSLPEVVFFQEGPGIMAVDFRSEGVPLVRLAGIGGMAVTLDGCNYLDPQKVAQKWAHFRLAVNDLLISTSATFGLSSIVTDATAGAVFYTGLIRFRPSNERLNLGYLKAFLGSPYFARQAECAAVGGGIKHFGPTHLKQMEIPIPTLTEQQRIAECLSSIDELITAQTQKLDAIKVHKKGLMQQLFPALNEVNE